MKTYTRLTGLLSAFALCMVLSPLATAAEKGEKYVELEISFPADASVSTVVFAPASGQLTAMNGTMFNGFMPELVTTGTTSVQIFDRTTASGVPSGAKITRIEITSSRTVVPGMTHYVQVGKGSAANNIIYAPDIPWAATVTADYFNNQAPKAFYALRFYATRIILDPINDIGAGITITNATMKVYWED